MPYDLSIIKEVIPSLVDTTMNRFLINIPSLDENKSAVFNLSKGSASGPDGFGGVFYHTHRHIIHHDVTNDVLDFFKTCWILHKHNSNTLILLPKTRYSNTMNNFRPIALGNFKFKRIIKILVDMLVTFMPNLVSME